MGTFQENIFEGTGLICAIQNKVNEIVKDRYRKDDCPPEFIVSILYEGNIQRILLTIKHLGSCFSAVLFPKDGYDYGYGPIDESMEQLYCRTM